MQVKYKKGEQLKKERSFRVKICTEQNENRRVFFMLPLRGEWVGPHRSGLSMQSVSEKAKKRRKKISVDEGKRN